MRNCVGHRIGEARVASACAGPRYCGCPEQSEDAPARGIALSKLPEIAALMRACRQRGRPAIVNATPPEPVPEACRAHRTVEARRACLKRTAAKVGFRQIV